MSHRVVGSALALLAVVACGGGGSTGPSYPSLAGTYSAQWSLVATSDAATDVLAISTGTVTLNAPSSSGNFTGSYIEGGTDAGTIAGTEHVDGGIDITQFGNPNVSPYEDLVATRQELNACDFSQAGYTGGSGAVQGNTINLIGAVVLPCAWTVGNSVEELTTTVSITVTGTRQ